MGIRELITRQYHIQQPKLSQKQKTMKFYSLAVASTITLASAKLERVVNELAALQSKIDEGKTLNVLEKVKFNFLEKTAKCDCVKENINNNFYMACSDTGAKITDKDY